MTTPQLETLLDQFEAYLKSRDRSVHSVRAYLSDVRLFAAWFEPHTKEPFVPENVTDYDVRDWRDELSKQDGRKPATVNRKLAALSTFFDWAIEQGLAKSDPTYRVQGIIQQQTAPKALAEDDVKRILRCARKAGNLRDLALLHLLAATGLRASEVAALNRFDLEMSGYSGWVTVRFGKGKKQRRVPVNANARAALNEYLDSRGEISPSEALFLTEQGERMKHYTIWYTVKKYAAQAGVKNVSPHSYRHTVATRLVRNPKVDIVTAATFLGHSRIETTARYARPSDDDLAKAAEQIG